MARRTGPARVLAVLAVLVGMFLMHGAPTSAMGGCHDGTSATMPAAQPMAAPFAAPHTVQLQPPSASGMGSMSGLCLSTGVRDHLALPALALVALAALVLSAGVPGAGGAAPAAAAGRRGPPGGGRQLLLRVCIART